MCEHNVCAFHPATSWEIDRRRRPAHSASTGRRGARASSSEPSTCFLPVRAAPAQPPVPYPALSYRLHCPVLSNGAAAAQSTCHRAVRQGNVSVCCAVIMCLQQVTCQPLGVAGHKTTAGSTCRYPTTSHRAGPSAGVPAFLANAAFSGFIRWQALPAPAIGIAAVLAAAVAYLAASHARWTRHLLRRLPPRPQV